MDEALGMMDEGYFVSRSEILSWLNTLLQLNLTKIEQLGTGAVYCQLLDMLYPSKVPMNKVNWKAKLEYEFLQNLKILQNSFIFLKIGRMIEIERLSKAKYQDNLEFIQWFKRFFEMRSVIRNETYDPVARRGHTPVDFSFAEKVVKPKVFIKKNTAEKKEVLKENIASANKRHLFEEKGKENQKKKGLFEEKDKEKALLKEIQRILCENKEEIVKMKEIYQVFGMKNEKFGTMEEEIN